MCLITKQHFPKIALRNIPIYKEVYESNGNLYSFVMRSFIASKEFPITHKPDSKFIFPNKILKTSNIRCVEEGFIHCYKSKPPTTLDYKKILIGYIPRFTLYYESYSEYAARKVIYTKEVCE